MSKYSKLLSVLIISRNRFDELLKAINSVIEKTADLSRVEIALRFDDDDEASLSRIDELPKDKIDMVIKTGERYGYEYLHKYVNELCPHTNGEFLVWFNDDCVIETKDWDNLIAPHKGKIICFYPNNKKTGSGNIFPIISRKVYEILGHFSQSQQVDTWQQIVCKQAGIETKLNNLVLIHNRKQDYVSDKNRSAILKKTRKVWNRTKKDRAKDAEKIKKYLESQKK